MSASPASARAAEWLADHITPLAALAVALGLAAPSQAVARRSDVLLAALVLATAAQIDPRALRALRRNAPAIGALAVGTLIVLTGVAWLISRLFTGDVRTGVLSLGLASTEVASVGLVGLAGADTVLALGVLTVSLIASAVLGPVLAGLLGSPGGHGGSDLGLLARFALIVLVPLAAGLLLRGLRPALERAAGNLDGVAALLVCALLYAAISGVHGGELGLGMIGSAAFILASSALGLLLRPLVRRRLDPDAVLFTTGLRDFAVAATLAAQAFGTRAASIAGEYGALMLLLGAATATLLRRRARAREP
ncbi:MAG TPA: bile acid:sodium symporter [Solirubrobacteraceae bacterium]|nr:bile acid:sodium symporter [Solirubrobacteraceae bacterium]